MGLTSPGVHAILDCEGCDAETLLDASKIREFLSALPVLIGMRVLLDPIVVEYDGGAAPIDAGITGFVVIATSHISIHTYPHRRFAFCDVFSCRPFDVGTVEHAIRLAFSAQRIIVRAVTRALPKAIQLQV